MSVSPNIWGKYMWSTFHFIAMGYPDHPSVSDRQTYKIFYETFGLVLPCGKCTVNYERHMREVLIDDYLKNSLTLFEWTVMVHNIVNKELGKSIWNVEYAKMYYLHLEQTSGEATRMYIDNSATKSMIFKSMICVNVLVVLIVIYIIWK